MTHANLISAWTAMPAEERSALLAQLSDEDAVAIAYDWELWARPNQLPPPGDWRFWLILSGRGWGKTKCGGEMVRRWVAQNGPIRIALVGQTSADVRQTMIEGASGILSCYSPEERAKIEYKPTKREIHWPNGSIAFTYSGDEPGQLRGPQHHFAWVDEVAKFLYPTETFDNLNFGLRLGADPRAMLTTTPLPIAIIRRLLKDKSCVVTRGTTFENAANLPKSTIDEFRAKYEGTRIGRQELYAEVLEDFPGAFWTRPAIDLLRVKKEPALRRIVVAIDPAATAKREQSAEEPNETGIIVSGVGEDGHGYVLEDLSGRYSPGEWASAAVGAYHRWHADAIVAERNNGGDMVESTIRTADAYVRVKLVWASRGKAVRAEPISALYEQGRCHHVGAFDKLEDQMCALTPEGYGLQGSPDRADALVWALSDLMSDKLGVSTLFLPEFKVETHVVDAELRPWWRRWVAIEFGARTAALWFCQGERGRVHVCREWLASGQDAERVGFELARISISDLDRPLSVYVRPDSISSAFGGKSVADQLITGMSRLLGPDAVFLDAYTPHEQHLGTRDQRMSSLDARRKKAGNLRLSVQVAPGEAEKGWEYVRAMLRSERLDGDRQLEFDTEFAAHLRRGQDGERREAEYRKLCSPDHTLYPRLVIQSKCAGLISVLPALQRSERQPALPAAEDRFAPAWALLLGMMAHSGLQEREPQDAYVARRLDAAVASNPKVNIFRAAETFESEWKTRQAPTAFRLRAFSPRRRQLVG